jgi:uncharacterized membrane protein YgcG
LRRAVVVSGALALAVSTAGPAWAAPPLEVTGQVTDQAAALGDGEVAARQAAESLAAETDVDLYTVFVPSFDGTEAEVWASETADLSALEESDVLLAVAVGEGTYEYSWWIDDSSPLSEVEVEAVMTGEVEPRLAASDSSGAVVALAEQLRSLAGPAEAQTTAWPAHTTVLVVVGIAAVLLTGHLLSRRRPPARHRAR